MTALRRPLVLLVCALALAFTSAVHPAPSARAEGELTGSLPRSGIGLAVFAGGAVSLMPDAAASGGCALSAVWLTQPSGGLIGYVFGAPAIVNQPFLAAYPGGVLPSTPLIVICSGATPARASYQLARDAFADVDHRYPVDFGPYPGAGGRYYLAELDGRIRLVTPGSASSEVLLDISAQILFNVGDEDGLQSVAFDPQFAANGYVYIYYSLPSPMRTMLARFTVAGDRIDPATRLELLSVPQTAPDHRGSAMRFGPDGNLYLGIGDGGVLARGQDRTGLHGAVIRIDVRGATAARPYTVPADNPFVSSSGVRPEVWAYGFRNPWRMDFDSVTGDLWLADVGDASAEEINIVTRGGNYGWPVREGTGCYAAATCASTGFINPVVAYTHADGCAVIGGLVYRGTVLPIPAGAFIFGDFCTGTVWYTTKQGQRTRLQESEWALAAFGRGHNNEVFLVVFEGPVLQLVYR